MSGTDRAAGAKGQRSRMPADVTMSRPKTVTLAVVLMYLGGIALIALGIITIFLRYETEAQTDGLAFAITLLGTGMILFGLLVISLASGVARASRLARSSATAVMLLGLVFAVGNLVAGNGDWVEVAIQATATGAVTVPLWFGPGRRYFAKR